MPYIKKIKNPCLLLPNEQILYKVVDEVFSLIIHSSTRLQLSLAHHENKKEYEQMNDIILAQRSNALKKAYNHSPDIPIIEMNPLQKLKIYYACGKAALDSGYGNCAECSYAGAIKLIENPEFKGKVFIATYKAHQLLMVRFSNDPNPILKDTDYIVDAWGGRFTQVLQIDQYELHYQEWAHNSGVEKCATYTPVPKDEKLEIKIEIEYTYKNLPLSMLSQVHFFHH